MSSTTTAANLTRQLLKTLPQQMLPRCYQHLDELPLSVNRKIDRPTLRDRALELFGHDQAAPAGR